MKKHTRTLYVLYFKHVRLCEVTAVLKTALQEETVYVDGVINDFSAGSIQT